VRRWIADTALALLAVGCAAPPPQQPESTPVPIEQRIEAITADARRSEHEPDPKVRAELADHASREAQGCLALAPHSAACLYGQALALGLEARAHPAHAGESLKQMLADLAAAEAVDPGYDEAGAARVQALVLSRAPGWPLGPGDPAAGVVAARRAVSLKPQYPPNLLALAEALAKSGDAQFARESYRRAREAALALPATPDRDEWLQEADRALRR
jgi:hypothetical protein